MTTVRDIRAKKGEEPITMLTAYDAVTAELCEDAGIDVLLVGDSLGNAVMGYDSTLPVTVEEMISHTASVVRGTEDTLVVADMPFLSVGVEASESIEDAGRMLKEAGANAVKIESGPHTLELTDRLTDLGIPVMAHLGLTPQHVNRLGYQRQGTSQDAADEIRRLAREHEQRGAFSLVLEHVPANLASQVTADLSIPTIGIGAGAGCDGQVLVVNDAVGMSKEVPPFVEQFGNVREELSGALEAYVEAVESGAFPSEEHSTVEDDLSFE